MTKSQDCDVLIVGAGATGALAATVLAQGGLDVLCLEQGAWVEPGDHPHYSSDWTWQRRTNWSSDVNKRHHPDDYPVETNSSQVLMWNGVGGSTNVYSAIWPRFRPSDFRKGDEHGLAPNWPISYEDLAPFYEKADRLIGTSGLAGDPAMPPRDPCPTGPLPFTRAAGRLAEAFDKLGWHWWPAEAGVISENYDGRPACNGCGICNGCPRGSMSKFSLSIWPKALLAGTRLRPYARALKIEKGPDGRATGVHFVDRNTGRAEFQGAKLVIIAANGVGTPRLLLASDNLANSSGPGRAQPSPSHAGHLRVLGRRADREPHGICRLTARPRIRRDGREPRLRQRLPVQLPDGTRRRRARRPRAGPPTRRRPGAAATMNGSSVTSRTASACTRSATTCRIPTTG